MLSAVSVPPAAVVPPRTTVARRAWLVLMLLGGFTALAFVFGGQAHAASSATPGVDSVPSATVPASATVCPVVQGVPSGAASTGASVADPVAAATGASSPVRPVDDLVDGLRGTTGQVTEPVLTDPVLPDPVLTTPVTTVIGTVAAGHGDSRHGSAHAQPSAQQAAGHVRPGGRTPLAGARTTDHPVGASADRRRAHGVRHAGHTTARRTTGPLPVPVRHSGHPDEGDGSAHHTDGAAAALPAAGPRVHHSAAAMPAAHGSAPLQRPSNVSVQPD